jgi:hypothetical protein
VSLCTDSFMDVLMELSSNSLVSKVEVSSSRLKSGCSSVATKDYFPLCSFSLVAVCRSNNTLELYLDWLWLVNEVCYVLFVTCAGPLVRENIFVVYQP